MTKYDVKKAFKNLYAPTNRQWAVVDVPAMSYLMIDGHGDPNVAEEYTAAVQTLYSVSYKAKFLSKADGKDFVVAPLEGLWWADDPTAFTARAKSQWNWTMMIAQPDFVDAMLIDDAMAAAKNPLPAKEKLRFESLVEGRCAQVLHVGSYDDETAILHELHHEWMPAHGMRFNGHHHEIYLSDPRRVPPEKLRTILRQPVR